MTAPPSGFLAGCLALLACQGAERPQDVRPPAISAPRPPREEQASHDEFHELLAKPRSDQAVAEVSAEMLNAAVARSNDASFEVWRALERRENLVVSPYSIRSALGLLYFGSLPGSGRSSMQSRLRYSARNEDTDDRLLHEVARTTEDTSFGSANSVWVARQQVLSPAYLDAVSRSLSAEVHAIDFAADPGRAERMVNAWGAERTRGQIPSILEAGSIQALTRSVLVDTVYVSWETRFNPGINRGSFSRSFSTVRGTTVKADMMACSPCLAVVRNDYQAALANYHGTSLVLVAVMPKRWSGFRWDAANFRRVWASLADPRVASLELPTLRLRSREDLGAVMRKLDIDRLQQGLPASGEPVGLGALIHETSIRISESTVHDEPSPHLSKALLGERISVRLDRPFYFLLVEPKTGLVLLIGQVTDPTA
jgi:serine protease inhibitor